MKKLVFLLFILALFIPCLSFGDEGVIDTREVRRLGDTVQHVTGDGGWRQCIVDAFVEAMELPKDDKDKWWITVITKDKCGSCTRLKKDWLDSEWLLSLADPKDPKKSWAHYFTFSANDKSQKWRTENIKITDYPTILVQPPGTKKYGKPETIVFQGLYYSNPNELYDRMQAAIRDYVEKWQVKKLAAEQYDGEYSGEEQQHEQDYKPKFWAASPPGVELEKVDATQPWHPCPNPDVPDDEGEEESTRPNRPVDPNQIPPARPKRVFGRDWTILKTVWLFFKVLFGIILLFVFLVVLLGCIIVVKYVFGNFGWIGKVLKVLWLKAFGRQDSGTGGIVSGVVQPAVEAIAVVSLEELLKALQDTEEKQNQVAQEHTELLKAMSDQAELRHKELNMLERVIEERAGPTTTKK